MATETLRPNAYGDETNLDYYDGSLHDADQDYNYLQVDEETPDEGSTRVQSKTSDNNWYRDLYNIENHSVGSGTINKITVYARCRNSQETPDQASLKIVAKSGSTIDESSEKTIDHAGYPYSNYSEEWATNPDTGSAWTWSEIDDLQIGVNMRRSDSSNPYYTACTQVYVEVDYTPVTEKTSSDAGSGLEGTPMQAAILAGTESGSGIEALFARLLAAFDIGTGNEAGGLQYDRDLLATELGQGSDSLTIKIEMPTKGGGMKLWT